MPHRRTHESPASLAQFTGYAEDLWRLQHSGAFAALAQKSLFLSNSDLRPAPTLLLLATQSLLPARLLATRLMIDACLVECLVILPLLGRPAGGELGIKVLNELMQPHGHFQVNAQSLRLIDELETIFPEHNGLNLSESLRSVLLRGAHSSTSALAGESIALFSTRISDLHLKLLYLSPEIRDPLLQQSSLWKSLQSTIAHSYPQLESRRLFRYTLHQFGQRLVEESALVSRPQEVVLTPATQNQLEELETGVRRVADHYPGTPERAIAFEATCVGLFTHLCQHPELLPEKLKFRLKKDGVPRLACDYLASLSDHQLGLLAAQYCPARSSQNPSREQMVLL